MVDMDYRRNNLIVTSDKADKRLFTKTFRCSRVNWVSGVKPSRELPIQAVVRYRHQPIKAVICKKLECYEVKLFRPQRAVMPGQSVVFYHGEELLGGGVIDKVNY